MLKPLADRYRSLVRTHRIDHWALFGFLLLVAAVFFFMKLASEVVEGDTLGFDRWLLQALRSTADPSVPAGPRWLQTAMIDVTALGGVAVLTIITIIAVGYLVAGRKWAMGLFLAGAVIGGSTLNTLLKLGFARNRPDIVAHLVDVQTASFPSGHAMNSAVVYLTLGALLARAEKDRAVRLYLISVAIMLTLIIGSSRVYLGVHWPSDVIAGWCVGASWALLCSLAARMLQKRRKLEQPGETSPLPGT